MLNTATAADHGFTQKNRLIKNSVRTSSLYSFMDQFNNKWIRLLPKGLKFTLPVANRPYFIISLEPGKIISAYSDLSFTLVDAHIRIDRQYGTPESTSAKVKLFAHWHYTEEYSLCGTSSSSQNQSVKIHCYFHYSRFLSAYMTVAAGQPERITDPRMLQSLERNCLFPKEILNKLLTALSQQRLEAENAFTALIKTIENPKNACYRSEDRLRAILAECKNASDVVNSLNGDCEIDCRYQLIEAQINNILISSIRPQIKAAVATNDDQAVNSQQAAIKTKLSPSTPKTIVAQTAVSFDQVLAGYKSQLNRLEKDYKNNASTGKLISLEEKRKGLFDNLVIEFVGCKNQKHAQLLDKEFERISKLPTLLKHFIECLMKGNLDSIQQLYNFVKHEIPKSLYKDFYRHLSSTNMTLVEEEEYVKILAYLYKVSDDYRLFTSLVPYVLFDMRAIKDVQMSQSFAYQLAMGNRAQLFAEHIEQVGSTNIVGIRSGQYIVSLATAVANISRDDQILKFMLDKATVSEDWRQFSSEPMQLLDARALPCSAKNKFAGFFNETVNNDGRHNLSEHEVQSFKDLSSHFSLFAAVDSVLYAYCNQEAPKEEFILRLLPSTSDFYLLLSFTYFIVCGRKIMLPSNQSKLQFLTLFSNDSERQMVAKQHQPKGYMVDAQRIKYFLLPCETHYAATARIASEVQSRFANYTEPQFKKLHDILDVFAQQQCAENNFMLAIIGYNAKLLLLNYQDATLDVHKQLLAVYSALIDAHSRDVNSRMSQDRDAYIQALAGNRSNLLDYSCFSAELKSTVGFERRSKQGNNLAS